MKFPDGDLSKKTRRVSKPLHLLEEFGLHAVPITLHKEQLLTTQKSLMLML